jgi:hypothetical protein
MKTTSFQQHPIQQAYQQMIERYDGHLTDFLTITFFQEKCGKHEASNGGIHHYNSQLTEQKVKATTRHIIARLNYKMFGRKTRKKETRDDCKIIAISSFEGKNGNTHMHMHLLLGNIPEDKKEKLHTIIDDILKSEPWVKGFHLEPIHQLVQDSESCGAARYVTKDIGHWNNECINFDMIPKYLLNQESQKPKQ